MTTVQHLHFGVQPLPVPNHKYRFDRVGLATGRVTILRDGWLAGYAASLP